MIITLDHITHDNDGKLRELSSFTCLVIKFEENYEIYIFFIFRCRTYPNRSMQRTIQCVERIPLLNKLMIMKIKFKVQ